MIKENMVGTSNLNEKTSLNLTNPTYQTIKNKKLPYMKKMFYFSAGMLFSFAYLYINFKELILKSDKEFQYEIEELKQMIDKNRETGYNYKSSENLNITIEYEPEISTTHNKNI